MFVWDKSPGPKYDVRSSFTHNTMSTEFDNSISFTKSKRFKNRTYIAPSHKK